MELTFSLKNNDFKTAEFNAFIDHQTRATLSVVSTCLGTHTISSSFLNLLVVRETQNGKQLIIEGVIITSPREKYYLKTEHDCNACPLCRLNLDIKHTDVLILCQFLRSDGCMLPRRVTGLCKIQQRRVATMVAMAQKAGLMSNITPANSKRDPSLRRDWKKCNTYFYEDTIRLPKKYMHLLYEVDEE